MMIELSLSQRNIGPKVDCANESNSIDYRFFVFIFIMRLPPIGSQNEMLEKRAVKGVIRNTSTILRTMLLWL